jgi:multidrug efflux system membrane fusion protein
MRLGSWGIVGLVLAAFVAWMLTGLLGGGEHAEAVEHPAAAPARPAFTVGAREQRAQDMRREVVINGDTQPDQVVDIAAQFEGQIIAVGPRKGARVQEGEVLARIHPRELEQQKARADAQVRTRTLEHAAAEKLRATGYVTEAELASRFAALELARAEAKEVEVRLLALTIKAPVAGILEDRAIEVGDYVKVGQPVVKLIKIDPLLVSAPVSENDVARVRVGAAAVAEVQGRTLPGRVRFVSSLADPETRTFTVEVAVDNPDSAIPAGLSARVSIPVETLQAQRVAASLLSLADDGAIGVKHVVDGKVVFTPAQIVRADGDALWLSGLPERMVLITRGQGYVDAGEPVQVELERTAAAGEG